MYCYFESRGGPYQNTIFFGLQYLLKEYLTTRITPEMVREAQAFFQMHGLPFPEEGWMRIATELEGRLPVRICAVPEGTVIPSHNILLSVESTDPQTFWVASWLETLLVRLWYPITVATRSYHLRQVIYTSLLETADDPDSEIGFKLHDFGSRGTSSQESAAIGGAAHLVNFQGSDTVMGIRCANHYYRMPMAAYSIPAAEHSTITAWGKDREQEAYFHILRTFAKPGATIAVVSDSYNIWHAVEHLWGEALRKDVVQSGATVVIRPDSGNPASVVLTVLRILEGKFGAFLNQKGYKVLRNVRVIQGDGVNENSIRLILKLINEAGYSTTNLFFGMGGALLQQLDRDTLKMAYKCSEVTIDGQVLPVFKNPVTDPGKRSKSGRLDLVYREGKFETCPAGTYGDGISWLEPVFENGTILRETTLENVRKQAWPGKTWR